MHATGVPAWHALGWALADMLKCAFQKCIIPQTDMCTQGRYRLSLMMTIFMTWCMQESLTASACMPSGCITIVILLSAFFEIQISSWTVFNFFRLLTNLLQWLAHAQQAFLSPTAELCGWAVPPQSGSHWLPAIAVARTGCTSCTFWL